MEQTFKISGMSCNHCRGRVEKALNEIAGVKAVVTLNPPVATVEFSSTPLPIETLQKALSEVGGYTISV